MTRKRFNELCDGHGFDWCFDLLKRYRFDLFDTKSEGYTFYNKRQNIDEDKVYLTIRAGLGGIYTMINTYKNGDWETQVLDGSKTIYYKEFEFYDNSEFDTKTTEV